MEELRFGIRAGVIRELAVIRKEAQGCNLVRRNECWRSSGPVADGGAGEKMARESETIFDLSGWDRGTGVQHDRRFGSVQRWE